MTQLDSRATVRGRRIATELRKLREARNLTAQEAADALSWSRPKLNKFETASRRPTVADVEVMLDLYGCDEALRAALIQLTRNIAMRGWWTAYDDVLDPSFLELEDDAVELRAYQRDVIPGLLQTNEYAMALIKLSSGESDEKQLRRVAARAARRRRLTQPDAPVFHAVIEEFVLRRPIGGRDVMREQWRALLLAAEQPHVEIQVMPQEVWQHPGHEGSFLIMGFGGPVTLDVLYLEGAAGVGRFLEAAGPLELSRFNFASISKAALPVSESTALIEGLLAE